jgi:uncharacterized membrane protein
MTPHNESAAEPTLFSATLTPHRSLTRRGLMAVMLAIAGLSFLAGIVFFAMGAWPVVGFLGLDVALVWWAFRANEHAGRAYEKISVSPSELTVRKVSASGAVAEWTANPVWVRLDRDMHDEFGLQGLSLVSRGKRLPIAAFLGPDEKLSFAQALAAALGEAKRGPTRTVFG